MGTQSDSIFVSIALATYNGERFLGEQLDSLLTQTYSNFEIVISDDASTDSTHKILDEYQKKDKRIKWTVNPNPNGFIKNFEHAISLCKGEVIFLCDQDDVWYENKIAEHVKIYKDKNIKWVYNEVRLIDTDGAGIGCLSDKIHNYYTPKKLLHYTWGSCTLGCATSYRSDLIWGIWPADKYAPGHDSWIQLAIFPAKSFHIRKVLQDYRQHENNVFGLRDSVQDERNAISGNLRYLRSLVKNDRLQFWERAFFVLVLVGKKSRTLLRRLL